MAPPIRRRRARPVLLAFAALTCAASTACIYGFAGGGLPPGIKTVAVLPFENETPAPELQRELAEELRKALSSRLGLREASEEKASAVVRGTIVRYETDVPEAFSANPAQATSARRRLQVVVKVEILNQLTGKPFFTKELSAFGAYAENAEAAGRKQAIDKIVNDVIEGAQSAW
ncbi:MAG: LptE family protein [Gemmatimonadales bacterium]